MVTETEPVSDKTHSLMGPPGGISAAVRRMHSVVPLFGIC